MDRPTCQKRGSEVRLHHEPLWLRQRISAALKRLKIRREYPGQVVTAQIFAQWACVGHTWIDHSGSIEHGAAWVSEPYLQKRHLAYAQHFADMLGLSLTMESESAWNPPLTTRLVFRPLPE